MLEIYFHLNNNLRKRKKYCATSSLYSKKSPGLFFLPKCWVETHFLGLFVQCLGSLCTFYFIDKIVSVQYIILIYAEQHSRCESLNERPWCRVCLIA